MGLVPENARLALDREVAVVRSLPRAQLVDRYRRRSEERRRVTEGGKELEVKVIGELDYEEDPESFVYVWLSVCPAWLAPMPVLRWFMTARATLVIDEDGHDWSLGDPSEE